MVRRDHSVDLYGGEREKVGEKRGGIGCGGRMVAGVKEELISFSSYLIG